MFHLGDLVEEIATGRRGKVDQIFEDRILGREPVPHTWRVYFSDKRGPLVSNFKQGQLRLIECPHAAEEPGFVPESPIF